jgi:replicative DNA helicase
MSALCDVELERVFLGACLMDAEYREGCGIHPHEMSSPAHRDILATMLAAKGTVDGVSLRADLAKRGMSRHLEAFDAVFLTVPYVSPGFAPRLRELARARALRDSALRSIAALEAGRIEDGFSELTACLADAGEMANETTSLSAVELIIRGVESVTERSQLAEQGRPVAMTTGLVSLDIALGDSPEDDPDPVLGGWEPGDYVVVGGDTNVGKSSVALAMAFGAARKGVRVGIVSVEDPVQRTALRALSAHSGVPQHVLRGGRLSKRDWEAVMSSANGIADLPMRFEFEVAASLPSVCAAVRRLVRQHRCQIVIIDYLQAIQMRGGGEARHDMRDIIAQTKRAASIGLDVPAAVVALSQFRKRENTEQRPTREDLYESAYIAQKAEHIVLLWKQGGVLNAVLDKTKDGRTGAVFQLLRGASGQLMDADERIER